jgi:DMATS type aromatic prenyltransferase
MSSLHTSVAGQAGSLRQAGLTKLESLCDALTVTASQRRAAVQLFEEISFSWGDWAVGTTPLWSSDITDDGTPFEFSVAFESDRHELRMLFESQERPLTNRSSWDAGVAFGERLRTTNRADLTLFDRVSDLFAPATREAARFSLWHAAVLRDEACLYKVYFNPELEGPARAAGRVDTALERLGLNGARKFVSACMAKAPYKTRLPYFSLDLEHPDAARAKVYLATESAAHAAAIVAETGSLDPSACSDWLSSLVGQDDPKQRRPVLVCAVFRQGSAPPDVTVHIPIRCFTDNDAEAAERLTSVLSELDVARLRRAMEAVSGRAAETTQGVLTYASLRQTAAALRVTGYLAPQLYTAPVAASSGTHTVTSRSK